MTTIKRKMLVNLSGKWIYESQAAVPSKFSGSQENL